MPQRLGPILFGPPLLKSWQAVQAWAVCLPFSGSALARSGAIGSMMTGAGAAAGAPPSPPEIATASPPPWDLGFTSIWPMVPTTIVTKPPTRMAPMTLFNSSVDISEDPVEKAAACAWNWSAKSGSRDTGAAAECNGSGRGCPMPEQGEIPGFPRLPAAIISAAQGSSGRLFRPVPERGAAICRWLRQKGSGLGQPVNPLP